METPTSGASNERLGHSQLLGLPPELRNIIYRMAFEGCLVNLVWNGDQQSTAPIGLILASKQTYAETINIYYSQMTVRSCSYRILIGWASKLPPKYLREIPKIQFDVTYRYFNLCNGEWNNNASQDYYLKEICNSGLVIRSEQLSLVETDNEGRVCAEYYRGELVRY